MFCVFFTLSTLGSIRNEGCVLYFTCATLSTTCGRPLRTTPQSMRSRNIARAQPPKYASPILVQKQEENKKNYASSLCCKNSCAEEESLCCKENSSAKSTERNQKKGRQMRLMPCKCSTCDPGSSPCGAAWKRFILRIS